MEADGATDYSPNPSYLFHSCRQRPCDNQVFGKGIDLCKLSFLVCVTV